MTFDGVPWAVGGGAVMQAEVLRLIGYLAADAGEGVVGGADCAVLALPVPDAGVRVMPGAVAMLNRSADAELGAQQAYVARNPAAETVDITATNSGGGRTDLVAVIVEDPQYAGQPDPASVQDGPYVRVVVYEGVGAGVTRLDQVDAGQTGLALARVTLPASTSAVQAGHITDLRSVPNPRVRQETKIINLPNGWADATLTAAAYTTFPSGASWNVEVPSWASRVHLELYVSGVWVDNDSSNDSGNWSGKVRAKLGTVVTADAELNPTVPQQNKRDTCTYLAAGDLAVPKALRGTTQALTAQALKSGGTADIALGDRWGTTVVLKATFFEQANTDYWEV